MPYDPHQSILNIIGGQYLERWPDEESRIILNSGVFTYSQRLTALTFLYGNIATSASCTPPSASSLAST